MDAKLVAGYLMSGADFSKLPDVAEAAGLESKDANMLRYVVSAAPEDLKKAISSASATEAAKAVTRISEDLSVGKEKLADIIDQIRYELEVEVASKDTTLNVNNIGNNNYLGLGGLIFKPSKDFKDTFDLVRYMGEGGDVKLPMKIRVIDLVYKVEEIEANTFRNTDVRSVVIPEGYRIMETGVFDGCEHLESVSIPSTMESIGNGAFKKCKKLAKIEVAEGNKSFWTDEYGILYTSDRKFLIQAPGALEGDVTLPESLEVICDTAFNGCEKVTGVTMGPKVKRIGKSAFSGCSSLSRIKIPASMSEISDYAFNGCASLPSIDADDGEHFVSRGGLLYSKDMKTLVRAPGAISREVVLPDTVETIGQGAFQSCEKLSKVTMKGVRTISNEAFKGCISLLSAPLDGVESIGKYAFMGCVELDSVVVPDSVKSIGTWAFGECKSLKKASVPGNIDILPSVFPQDAEVTKR